MTKILFVCHGRAQTGLVLHRFTTIIHGTV